MVTWHGNNHTYTEEYKTVMFMVSLSVVLGIIGYEINILNRFNIYFSIFICILLPYRLSLCSHRNRLVWAALLILMSVVYCSRMLYVAEPSVLVYKSCF